MRVATLKSLSPHTTMAKNFTAATKSVSPVAEFKAAHKNAEFVQQCALHYRATPYQYILGWMERKGYTKRKTDDAAKVMAIYGFKFA